MHIRIVLLGLLLLLGACSAKPVLYPNDHYKAVGEEQAKADVETCIQRARDSDLDEDSGFGNVGTNMGVGIGVGSRGRTGVGVYSGMYGAPKPDSTYRRFVNKCLREMGYEPIGWE